MIRLMATGACMALVAGAVVGASGWGRRASSERLERLLTERRDCLRTILAATEQRFKLGQASTREVVEAKVAVLKAEAALCKTGQERLGVLEKIVDEYRKGYESAKAQHTAGLAMDVVVAEARLELLDAEIELERERLGGGR